MSQEDFFDDIKATWQSVELPHRELLKKARRNAMWYRLGVAYNAIASLVSIVAGIWMIVEYGADPIFWLIGFLFVVLLPYLSYFSTKSSWHYIQWDDKGVEGTLDQLIKQCKITIRLHRLAKRVALYYVAVPLTGVSMHYLGLTQVPLRTFISVGLGVVTSTVFIVFWVNFKIKRKNAELEKLKSMRMESQLNETLTREETSDEN